MSRRSPNPSVEIDPADAASMLTAIVSGAVANESIPELANIHCSLNDDGGRTLLATLALEMNERAARLRHVEGVIEQLRALVAKLESSPWYPARVIDTSDLARTGYILVAMGGSQRLVIASDRVDPTSFRTGDLVYVSRGGDAVMAVASPELNVGGETAAFDRVRLDGRIVARIRDEEILLRRGAGLDDVTLRRGSLLRIDRGAQLALEYLGEQNEGSGMFVDDLDQETTIGGGRRARETVKRLVDALTARLVAPDLADRYGLRSRRAVLLSGPPGTGKTLAVRNAIKELARIAGRPCRLAIVRPGEFESPWVGATEDNIRSTFARLALEAGDQPAVLFLDEIESIGRARGASLSHLGDKFLAALLVEIDGLVRRGNIAVIAATNRRDLLDSALLERIAEIDIEVPRPDLEAAREIFAVHLAEDLPYFEGDRGAAWSRRQMIDAAVSALYAPNAGARIATIHFRDSTTRAVEAREMISGRLIEQMSHRARELAYQRALAGAVAGQDGGIGPNDIRDSVAETLDRLRSMLTIHNVRSWVNDLPAEIDIVKVTAEKPSVARPYRYLRAA
ncbi:MAG TPA: ATP-binding protein [Candidatus Binatia bacterium]|jgi:ATP-dependent 26S proteasome regulatory subunit